MRRHLNYANVIATLALFFAMSGGALAAKHYLINSTKQINPKVIKALKGNRGPTGPKGATGAAGAAGAAGGAGKEGAAGKEGSRGQSALVPLESGQTITGIVGGRFQNGATAKSPMGAVASFPERAPVVITNSHIQIAPTANCTGTVENPTAASGFVCIYPSVEVSAEKLEANAAIASGDVWGFILEWTATKANEQSSVRASWAYTAP